MEKSKDFILKLFKDLQWKVLALALAFILWFVGTNVTNPVQHFFYENLALNVVGRDLLAQNNLVLLNESDINSARVSVSVQATSSNHLLIQANRDANIQASINLNTINFEQVLENDDISNIPVDVNVFIHQEHRTMLPSPSFVNLALDRHEELVLPVLVDIIGEVQEGFVRQTHTISPRSVRLSGARSVLREVSDVRVRVYVNEAGYTVEEPRPLIVYNSAREEITSKVNLSVQSANVMVPVLPYAEVPLRVATVGTTMGGFVATDTIVDPPTVLLVGDTEALEEVSPIILGPVNITLARENVASTFNIRQALIGTGLVLKPGEPDIIESVVVVERVTSRDLQLPLESLVVTGYARPFTFETEGPITLTFRGQESIINALDLRQISARVDLTGFGAGAHTVQIEVVTPPRVVLANLATVDITIEPEHIIFEPEELPELNADLDGEDEDEEYDSE